MATEDITYRNIDDLALWSENYRQGDLGAIIMSIVAFGYNAVLRVWRQDTVIAGNHSLMALRELHKLHNSPERFDEQGNEKYPVPNNIIESDDGAWLAPCLDVSRLTKAQATAFAIADNRTSELATNDTERLSKLLKSVHDINPSLVRAASYDESDIASMMRRVNPPLLGDNGFNYEAQYGVIVMLEGEKEQQDAYNKLREMGYDCKVVTV